MIHRGDSADKAKSLFHDNASIIPREYRATLRPLVVDYPGSCYLKLKAICYQNGTKIPVNGRPVHWHNFTPPYIEEKAENIKRRGGCTLKELQSFLGKLEASRAAIVIARLHFRFMQALLRGKEDDKEFIKFNEKAKIDLQWWIDFARKHSTSPLQAPRLAKLNIKTDASGDAGWGGHSRRGWTQARWERKEKHKHINWKEMEAAKKCIAEHMKSREHVQIEMDSLTSTCIINSMARSTSATLRQKALEIWEIILSNQGWLTQNGYRKRRTK